jgi:hypothetical protein
MQMLSDDDTNLSGLSDEELECAWDLWFDLAQSTNDADPPYTHGVFVGVARRLLKETDGAPQESEHGTGPTASRDDSLCQ